MDALARMGRSCCTTAPGGGRWGTRAWTRRRCARRGTASTVPLPDAVEIVAVGAPALGVGSGDDRRADRRDLLDGGVRRRTARARAAGGGAGRPRCAGARGRDARAPVDRGLQGPRRVLGRRPRALRARGAAAGAGAVAGGRGRGHARAGHARCARAGRGPARCRSSRSTRGSGRTGSSRCTRATSRAGGSGFLGELGGRYLPQQSIRTLADADHPRAPAPQARAVDPQHVGLPRAAA